MKTRMHRFWLSLSLAAGSLASPLSGRLWSHDLPTRWSSEAVAAGSGWNYLLNDCLDARAARSSDRSVDESFNLGCNDWDNPASNYLAATPAMSAQDFDFDSLVTRNSLAKFTHEMANWVQEWDRLQTQAQSAAHARLVTYAPASRPLLAFRPDLGVPPAPAVAAVDTCIFEKEYQRAQEAHDQLVMAFSPATAPVAAPKAVEAARADQAAQSSVASAVMPSARCQFAMDQAGDDSEHYSSGNYYLDDLTVAHYGDASKFSEYTTPESDAYSQASSNAHSDFASYMNGQSARFGNGEAASSADSDDLSAPWSYDDDADGQYRTAIDQLNSSAYESAATLDERRADQLASALAAAAAIEAASIDAITAAVAPPALCGGEAEEIVSDNPPSYPSVANCVDEYMPYDLDPRDAHWLGGLGKTWKLSVAATAPAREITDSEGALPKPPLDAQSPQAASPVVAAQVPTAPSCPEVPADANEAAQDVEISNAAPAVDSIEDEVAAALEWLDDASCAIAAELCGMDAARALGAQWGQWTLSTAQQSMPRYVAIGHYLDMPPAVANPGLDTVVVYTDLNGVQTTVPSSLARAWNRPASEYDDQFSSASPDSSSDEFEMFDAPSMEQAAVNTRDSSDFASSEASVTPSDDVGAAAKPVAIPAKATLYELIPSEALSELRQEVISVIAAKLDSLGIRCLETADQLSNWAEMQIASRLKSDIR